MGAGVAATRRATGPPAAQGAYYWMCHLVWGLRGGLEAHVRDKGRMPYWAEGLPHTCRLKSMHSDGCVLAIACSSGRVGGQLGEPRVGRGGAPVNHVAPSRSTHFEALEGALAGRCWYALQG